MGNESLCVVSAHNMTLVSGVVANVGDDKIDPVQLLQHVYNDLLYIHQHPDFARFERLIGLAEGINV